MSADDLSAPLGLAPVKAPRLAGLSGFLPKILAGLGVALLGFFVLWIAFVDDPLGGEPQVKVALRDGGQSSAAQITQQSSSAQTTDPSRNRSTAQELEIESGVAVVRPGGASAPSSLVIRAPAAMQQDGEVKLVPAPQPRLIEKGKHGALPKLGDDGSKPMEVYARPVIGTGATKPNGRIAIVVGGLGINAAGTNDTISRLPGVVTLAFAPYGYDMERLVSRARDDGHEVMLQLPMEPFDYPDNDPGPQTLLTSATHEINKDRLHWLLSRFPGYVGVSNYMGAKMMSEPEKFSPIMRELGTRGVFFLDDGSSSRSVTDRVASEQNAVAIKADVVIDANPRPQAIDAALARLEAIAQEKGYAIASASALPVSLERLAVWVKNVEGRGFELVPVSAIALSGR